MKTRLAFALILLVTLTASAQQGAPSTGSGQAPQNDSIRQDDLRADLFFLAGDLMRGRLTDTLENRLAAEYIRSRFERLGLTPAADGSYFQAYNLSVATIGSDNLLEVRLKPDATEAARLKPGPTADTARLKPGPTIDNAADDGAALRLRAGQDFYPHRFSASARARGSVVFAGFGIVSPERSHDDYRGGVADKIVLVLDHEPGERDPNSIFDGVVTAEASSQLRKTLAAQAQGALAVLFVADVHNHPGPTNFEATAQAYWPSPPPRIQRYALASMVDRVHIPAAQISPAVAEILIRGTGKTLAELARSAEVAGGVTPLALPGAHVDLTTSVDRHVVPDRNVVALIEGADARLKDEVVIVSAHFDHDGANGPQIFNGADDDGSGTVGLLEIGEAYAQAAQAGHRPRRSVLFAAWNAEERGLLGAWAYTEAPLFPLEKTVAVLNMDMIGRNEEVPEGGGARFRGLERQTAESNSNALNILGQTYSADLRAAVEQANTRVGLELKMRYDNNASNLLRRSDHWPFLQRGVPALWFHTGLHPDYHTQYDRPEKINYPKMEKIARLVHQLSWDLAQRPGRPAFAKSQAAPPTAR